MLDVETIKKIPKTQLRILAEKELAERSFYEYFQLVLKNITIYKSIEWELNWHYEQIGQILENELRRIIRGEPKTKDLILTLPYRSGKSTLLEIFASYCWVLNPTMKVLFIASTQSLSFKSARCAKIIFESDWFRQRWNNIILMKDSRARANFSNTLGGQFLAFSITNATGRGGDLIICDDLVQATDAFSDTKLRNVIQNYRDGIHSRLNNTKIGLSIICQQRISAKDLVGILKTTNPQDFREICLPAILTKDTSLDFVKFYDEEGLFFPTRYSLAELEKHKAMLSPTAFSSQLLQSSSIFEGDRIKRNWILICKQSQFQSLNKGKTFMFIDTNMGSDNKNNDPNGIMICTPVNGKVYVQKFYEKWEQLYEFCQTLIELIKIWNVSKVYIETAATGQNVITELKRLLRGKTIILGVNTGGKSKEERVNAIQPYLVNGRVIILEDEWNTLFMNYLGDFNHGKHDEAIDLIVYAIQTLIAGKKVLNDTPEDMRGIFKLEAEEPDLYD